MTFYQNLNLRVPSKWSECLPRGNYFCFKVFYILVMTSVYASLIKPYALRMTSQIQTAGLYEKLRALYTLYHSTDTIKYELNKAHYILIEV